MHVVCPLMNRVSGEEGCTMERVPCPTAVESPTLDYGPMADPRVSTLVFFLHPTNSVQRFPTIFTLAECVYICHCILQHCIKWAECIIHHRRVSVPEISRRRRQGGGRSPGRKIQHPLPLSRLQRIYSHFRYSHCPLHCLYYRGVLIIGVSLDSTVLGLSLWLFDQGLTCLMLESGRSFRVSAAIQRKAGVTGKASPQQQQDTETGDFTKPPLWVLLFQPLW